jgi:hypothetical protein
MESVQARVQTAATSVYEELDRSILRKMQVCICQITIILINKYIIITLLLFLLVWLSPVPVASDWPWSYAVQGATHYSWILFHLLLCSIIKFKPWISKFCTICNHMYFCYWVEENNVLRLALHKIKDDHLPQEKVRHEEIVTVLKSWLGRGEYWLSIIGNM